MSMSYVMLMVLKIKFFLRIWKMELASYKSSVKDKIDSYFIRLNEWTMELHCFLRTQTHMAHAKGKRHWHSSDAHTSWTSFPYVYK